MADPTRQLAEQIALAVERRIGANDPAVGRIVAEELASALGPEAIKTDAAGPEAIAPGAMSELPPAVAELGKSRIVVTSHGRNRSGIVARLAAAIDEFDGDIRDLSQTIVGDYFTMLFVIDLADAPSEGATFARLRQRLKNVAEDLGVHVVVMHDDILSTMHTI